MKHLIKYSILLLFPACGGDLPCPPEAEADNYTSGLCINSNEFDIDLGKIDDVVQKLEIETNRFFPDKTLDFARLLEDNIVMLSYWDFVYAGGDYVRGVTSFPNEGNDKIKYPTIAVMNDNCANLYYVTGHELLHIISKFHLSTDFDINAGHMVEHMYLNWANKTNHSIDDSVEGKLYQWIPSLCGW